MTVDDEACAFRTTCDALANDMSVDHVTVAREELHDVLLRELEGKTTDKQLGMRRILSDSRAANVIPSCAVGAFDIVEFACQSEPFELVAGQLDRNGTKTLVECLVSIQGFDGGAACLEIVHNNHSVAAGLVGGSITDDLHFQDLSVSGDQLLHVIFLIRFGQPRDEQFDRPGGHDRFRIIKILLSCSRIFGLWTLNN